MDETSKKYYRISQIEGKITWQVEELWEGGTVRGPYGTKEAAINNEEQAARDNGFIDDLVLKETVGAEISPSRNFEKDQKGNWHCVQACSINIEGKELVLTEGMSFSKGIPFMGVDVANYLEENP
ncbi:MAG: hypothetical protein PHQ43_02890 [Dehalococcoidales bacterium]|nr:hypothetical protein [Dehalococcoidales bacterium]